MTEGAYADHHPEHRAAAKPWNAALWPGASSSGSGVATAAGLCYGSLGSDTGGSIRFPSAANSVTGLKPTWGRVSRYGVFELAATLDHIGPMARSAVDCGAILGRHAGADPNDPTAVLEPVPDYLANLSAACAERGSASTRAGPAKGVDAASSKVFQDALRVAVELGAEIHEIAFPNLDHHGQPTGFRCAASRPRSPTKQPIRRGSRNTVPALAGLIELGLQQSGTDYQKIVLRREAISGAKCVRCSKRSIFLPYRPRLSPRRAWQKWRHSAKIRT